MQELVSEGLWKRVAQMSKDAGRQCVAVAYYSSDRHLKMRKGDVLVVDATDQAVRAAQTSVAVLRRALRRGARVFSVAHLHAKVFIFDHQVVIGSCNASSHSATQLVEAAIVTKDAFTLGAAHDLIRILQDVATPVDDRFLDRASNLKVTVPQMKARKRPSVRPNTVSAWLVRLNELDDNAFPDERQAAEAGYDNADENVEYGDSDISWARMTGNSTLRQEAKPGDLLFEISGRAGVKTADAVYPAVPILHRQDEPTCTRLYYEAYADLEDRSLTWGRFRQLAKRAALPSNISPHSQRQLREDHARRLLALWPT